MEILNLNSSIALNNGIAMPRLGLGVWQITDEEVLKGAILSAAGAGYRLIDTAKIYGNEPEVGRALQELSIPREELFITTKLWNADQGYESALEAIDGSLERLGLAYVDLYLVHWPDKDVAVRKDTWRAMEEILESGKAKAIGVSNYTIEHLEEMNTYARIKPAVNQIEFHPLRYQDELLHYCVKEGIVAEAYSPLARASLLSDARLLTLAQKYAKTPAQILIRWSLQHGCVVIPKSVHKERIAENADVFDFELSQEDMEALNALNRNESVL